MSLLKDIIVIVNEGASIVEMLMEKKIAEEVRYVKIKFTKWLLLWVLFVAFLILTFLALIFFGWSIYAMLRAAINPNVAGLIVGGVVFLTGSFILFIIVKNLSR